MNNISNLIHDLAFDVEEIVDSIRFDYQHTKHYALNTTALTQPVMRGEWLMMNCPNHQETRPSFGIHTQAPYTCNCFYCGSLGTLDEMVEELLNLQKGQGIYYLLSITGYVEDVKLDLDKVLNPPKIETMDESVLENYLTPKKSIVYEIGMEYLKRRGLNEKAIQTYQIGIDIENECITFPQRDRKGNLRFVQKRRFSKNPVNRFINDGNAKKKDILFGLHLIDKFKASKTPIKRVRLVESPIDAISNYIAGQASIALNGLILFPQQVREMQLAGITTIDLMLDNDEAGRKGATDAVTKLLRVGFMVNEVIYPNEYVKDANDCLRNNVIDELKIKTLI